MNTKSDCPANRGSTRAVVKHKNKVTHNTLFRFFTRFVSYAFFCMNPIQRDKASIEVDLLTSCDGNRLCWLAHNNFTTHTDNTYMVIIEMLFSPLLSTLDDDSVD